VTDDALIAAAADCLRPHRTADGRLLGDVGAALVTDAGGVHRGVCIDTASGTGFCAEHSAIAAMVTAGAYRIRASSPCRATSAGRSSCCRRAVAAAS
jgi:hypothetical protein